MAWELLNSGFQEKKLVEALVGEISAGFLSFFSVSDVPTQPFPQGQKADNDIAIFTKNGSYWFLCFFFVHSSCSYSHFWKKKKINQPKRYFFRFDEGDNLPTLYRCSQDAVTSEVVEGSRGFYDELKEVEERWEMVLSVSEEGEEEGFVGVDLMKMSLDGRYLGYLRDLTGGEDYSLLFRFFFFFFFFFFVYLFIM